VLLTAAEAVRGRSLPGRGRTLVLVAALAGLVLVTVGAGHGGGGTGPEPLLGVLAACGSGAAYAFATAQGEVLARSTGPLTLTTATTGVGALLLVPAALLVDGPRTTADPQAVALLVYLGLVTMALAYGLLYAGLRTASGSAATIATLLEPVTAAAVAAVVLGERVGAWGLVGTGLVLAAVAGLAREDPLVQPSGTAVVAGRARPSPE
jgi:DME family drug/metabolite transporter